MKKKLKRKKQKSLEIKKKNLRDLKIIKLYT